MDKNENINLEDNMNENELPKSNNYKKLNIQ